MPPEFSVSAQNFQFGASLKIDRRHSHLRTFVLFSFVKPSTVAVTHTASNSQPLLKMRTFSCFVAVNHTALLNGEFIQKCEFCREFCSSHLTFFFKVSEFFHPYIESQWCPGWVGPQSSSKHFCGTHSYVPQKKVWNNMSVTEFSFLDELSL